MRLPSRDQAPAWPVTSPTRRGEPPAVGTTQKGRSARYRRRSKPADWNGPAKCRGCPDWKGLFQRKGKRQGRPAFHRDLGQRPAPGIALGEIYARAIGGRAVAEFDLAGLSKLHNLHEAGRCTVVDTSRSLPPGTATTISEAARTNFRRRRGGVGGGAVVAVAMVGTGGAGGAAGVGFGDDVPRLNRRDEAVSTPRQCLYVTRCGRIVIERFAYFLGGDVEAIIEIYQRVAPKPSHQFVARDHLAGTFQQGCQKLEGTLLQLYFSPVLTQFALRQVDFENTELENLGGAVVWVHGSFHLDRAISEFSIRRELCRSCRCAVRWWRGKVEPSPRSRDGSLN